MTGQWFDSVLVAIPSINGGSLLARMLPTMRFPQSQVLVLDQGSTDDTAAICAANGTGLVQLGHARTYTQACNIAAQLARERQATYLCVCNNDLTFATDVIGQLFAEMERDPALAIAAPSQVVHDESSDSTPLSYRVFWKLQDVAFHHDTEVRDSAVQRLEADFCELTCALIRMSAIEETGFTDDEFGFYHEDADLGFRFRKAGYSCAYLPQAQINHFLSSTISREKAVKKSDYIARNKRYFAKKHLGFGFGPGATPLDAHGERTLLNQGLQARLTDDGLFDEDAPELLISHARANATGYFYTGVGAGQLTQRWADSHRNYRAIFTTSRAMRDALIGRGIAYSFHVPIGIDPDLFNPWGTPGRLYPDGTTYLAIVHGQQQRLLHTILAAWCRFAAGRATVRLVLYGPDLGRCMGRAPDATHRIGNVEVADYSADRVQTRTALWSLGAVDLARLYRSADYVIAGSHGEDAALALLQAAACGVPCLAVGRDATPGSTLEGALPILVDPHPAACGGADGQEPASQALLAELEQTSRHSGLDRSRLAAAGIAAVRSRFTLRHSAMAFYQALPHLQIRQPGKVVKRLERLDDADVNLLVAASGRRPGLAAIAGPRIGTIGRIAQQFGAELEDNGFAHASRILTSELGYFFRGRSRRASRLTRRLRASLAGRVLPPPIVPVPRSALLIGYIDAQLGLGQSLRGLASALADTAIPFRIYPVSIGVESRRAEPYMHERYDQVSPHAVNVIEVAAGELPAVISSIGKSHFSHSYNILRTYWELGAAPEVWRENLLPIDEVWAPNDFVAEGFRTIFGKTITVVPPCIDPPPPEPGSADHFGLDTGTFYFMFSFDYFSFPQRKNPLAVIRAFRTAFPDHATPVGLIMKSNGAPGQFPAIKHALRVAALDDRRIQVFDEALTRAEMLALVAAVDCYVSLHRAEGFGLALAEAMALGTPVIGTAYSGPAEFLREETGYPVGFQLKRIAPQDYIHTEGQVWAEPDEAAGAAAMARIFQNRVEAAAKATAARTFVAARYGAVAVGRIAEARLKEIFEASPGG